MPTASQWYDPSVFPELRDRPPWVMEEMISVQPSIPESLTDSLGSAAEELADVLQVTARAGRPLVVAGVGTAGHAARAVSLLLNEALTGSALAETPVEFRESADQAMVPRAGGLCLAVSHGGASRSTVSALAAARDSGASTALITAADDGPAPEAADIVLRTPVKDASFCHTVGFTSPILTATYLASTIGRETFPAQAVAAYLEELASLETAGLQVASNLEPASHLIMAGSLIDQPSAREAALKVAEGARSPTTALGIEDTLHGHLVGHDHDSGIVVMVTDHELVGMADHARDLLRASRHIGLRTAAVMSSPVSDAVDADLTTAGRLVLPRSHLPSSWTSLLGAALALQYLTVGLVREVGVNPDLIRREERPYREAVTLSGSKIRRS